MTDAHAPLALFPEWWALAHPADTDDPTAMRSPPPTLPAGPPCAGYGPRPRTRAGFIFSTHATRPKGLDLAAHPRAALCFHGVKRERQVRVEGMVTPVTDAEADAYFATRPRLSQTGAWASRPSQSMGDRCEWEQAVAGAALRFGVGAVPRPANGWGDRVVSEKIEFWHQRPFRHHDRRIFVRAGAARPAPWLFP